LELYIRFFADVLGENPMTRFITIAALVMACCVSGDYVLADNATGQSADDFAWADFRLSDEPSPSVNPGTTRPSVSEVNRLRQQRAGYIQTQRIARLESNAWYGHEPLRPSWSTVPMMSSRYPARRTIVIPYLVP